MLKANNPLLQDLESHNQGTIVEHATITNNVTIGEGTVIHSRTTIRGPAIIGDHCEIGPNTFISPYTSIGDHTTIRNTENTTSQAPRLRKKNHRQPHRPERHHPQPRTQPPQRPQTKPRRQSHSHTLNHTRGGDQREATKTRVHPIDTTTPACQRAPLFIIWIASRAGIRAWRSTGSLCLLSSGSGGRPRRWGIRVSGPWRL